MSELDPLPPDPLDAIEATIRERVTTDTRATLDLVLSGFEHNPARALRLVSEYANHQREFLSALGVSEVDKGGGDAVGGGVLREIVTVFRDIMERQDARAAERHATLAPLTPLTAPPWRGAGPEDFPGTDEGSHYMSQTRVQP